MERGDMHPSAAMEEGSSSCRDDGLGTDVLVEILRRVPPNSRRRLRLVCRQWRDVVNTRTNTDLRRRRAAKALVVGEGSAFVIDDILSAAPGAPGRRRELWTDAATARRFKAMSVVGTCNGLVCLRDNAVPGGAITLANPLTSEALAVPLLPLIPQCAQHDAYSFVYHPATGRYKVVRVPCHDVDPDADAVFAVQVFTLGEASWRDVPVSPAARCDLRRDVVSVDGATYWATTTAGGAEKVMSFDLDDERLITPIKSLPSVLSKSDSYSSRWNLTEVHGRLAIAFRHASSAMDKTDVWVMDGTAGGHQRWSRWYIVQIHTAPQGHRSWPQHRRPEPSWETPQQRRRALAWPLFVHGDDGEYVLTWSWSWSWDDKGRLDLYRHRPSEDTRNAKRGVVEISERNPGTALAEIDRTTSQYCSVYGYRTFAYVETTEPLSVYNYNETGPLMPLST